MGSPPPLEQLDKVEQLKFVAEGNNNTEVSLERIKCATFQLANQCLDSLAMLGTPL